MSLISTYRANGKLLLTGEYLVLHGAKAVALPLKVGQRLEVSFPNNTQAIVWQAFYREALWFSCELSPADFSIQATSDPEKAESLARILKIIQTFNPTFKIEAGTLFRTTLESNPEWGFGSSSTLISLLSQFSGVDAFRLNELAFQGSGFDIACATANGPILYQRGSSVEPVSLDYPFSDRLCLVYSGKKKSTAGEVNAFLKEMKVSLELVDEMSELSQRFLMCRDQNEFNQLIRSHEAMIGNLIGRKTLKSEFFTDFDGEIKSLGAWGGDFFLTSASEWTFEEVKKYFANKGLPTAFKWDDLILKR